MKKFVSFLIVTVMLLSCAAAAATAKAPATVTAYANADVISKHGNVHLDYTCEGFLAQGYVFGDMLTVSFLDKTMDLPFCSSYSDVDSGSAAVFARDGEEYLIIAINMGDFATANGIAVKTTFEDNSFTWDYPDGAEGPIQIIIGLKEAGAYLEQYEMHRLIYTNVREHCVGLTDEEFANFRAVTTTGMGAGRLFRSSSPVNPEFARNTCADAAMKAAGVSVVMNMADSDHAVEAYEGYADTYYSTVMRVALNMGMDVLTDEFRGKLAEGLRFFIENRGVYLVHCNEGKDRTGFVIAVLECLMGADYDEVCRDYMLSYANYYGVKADEARYAIILEGNIVKTLTNAFAVEDLKAADLSACAEAYLSRIGLSADEITALKTNLAE